MSELRIDNAQRATGQWKWGRLAMLMLLGAAGLSVLWAVDPRDVPVPLCGFHAATDLYCPGCGATRATHDLLHGHFLTALSSNALWVLLLPVSLYGAASESLYFVRGRRLPGNPLGKPRFWTAVIIAAAMFGILRNLPWEPFVYLVPSG